MTVMQGDRDLDGGRRLRLLPGQLRKDLDRIDGIGADRRGTGVVSPEGALLQLVPQVVAVCLDRSPGERLYGWWPGRVTRKQDVLVRPGGRNPAHGTEQ